MGGSLLQDMAAVPLTEFLPSSPQYPTENLCSPQHGSGPPTGTDTQKEELSADFSSFQQKCEMEDEFPNLLTPFDINDYLTNQKQFPVSVKALPPLKSEKMTSKCKVCTFNFNLLKIYLSKCGKRKKDICMNSHSINYACMILFNVLNKF